MLHCLLHCGFGAVLLKSFMNAFPLCSVVCFFEQQGAASYWTSGSVFGEFLLYVPLEAAAAAWQMTRTC